MRFDVDTTSATPIYAQLIAQVKHALAAGVLRPGDLLPSLRELARQLRVNPLTVARAYRELEQMGIVTTGHGRGSAISEQAVRQGADYQQDALVELVDRMLEDAYQLGASPDAVLTVVTERLQGIRRQAVRGAKKEGQVTHE